MRRTDPLLTQLTAPMLTAAVLLMAALGGVPTVSGQDRDLAFASGSERRVALVVGNNSYLYAPDLQNAANDANDLSAALTGLGFDVQMLVDADLRTLDRAIDEFIAKLSPGDVALFHYSGHGIQFGGENYLIPTDFKLKDPASVRYDAYSASKLHDRMAGASSRLNILMLDACRNNGFQSARSSSGGLAMMNAAEGSFIAFATGPGMTADDGRDGRNGLFTAHLLEAIEEPGLTLDEVFNRVRQDVYDESGNRQLPWTSSSVIGDFFFRWKTPEAAPEPEPAPEPTPTPGRIDLELTFWESIQNGVNPAMFEAYLSKYPEGHFAELARIRLDDLAAPPAPLVEQPTVAPPPVEEPPAPVVEPPAPVVEQPTAPAPQPAQPPAPVQPGVSLERLPVVLGSAGMQTRVARTMDELQALANARPDRRYSVFEAAVSNEYQLLGRYRAQVRVKKADAKRGRYTLSLREGPTQSASPGPGPRRTAPSLRPELKVSATDVLDREIEMKNAEPGEPIQFHAQGETCDEIVILEVREDRVVGYLAEAVR